MRLNTTQRALLTALDETVGAKTGDAVREAGIYWKFSANQASAFAHQDLVFIEKRGLVRRIDGAKPLIWLRTTVGSEYLKATSNAVLEPNPR